MSTAYDKHNHKISKYRFCLLLLTNITIASCALNQTKDAPPENIQSQNQPCSTLPASNLELDALELLDSGETILAREKLECALVLSPHSRRAALLLEQLDEDPLVYLGRQYYWYEVKSNETLSKLAEQFLGSRLKFVILARYNDIEVPASLFSGQSIKIPGRRDRPKQMQTTSDNTKLSSSETKADSTVLRDDAQKRSGLEQLHLEVLELEREGMLDKAHALMVQVLDEDKNIEGGERDLYRIRTSLIQELENKAQAETLSGNQENANVYWQQILKIDPEYAPAKHALMPQATE